MLDELVEQPFDHFLTATGDHRLRIGEGVFLKGGKAGFTGLDLRSDAAVPGLVTLGDELSDATVRTNRGGGLEAAGEGVVFDKAYVDFDHIFDLNMRGVWWVTRANDNMNGGIASRGCLQSAFSPYGSGLIC